MLQVNPKYYSLLITAVLERFSYFGIRVITLLYLIDKFAVAETSAFEIIAVLTAASFMFSLFSGWLSDRFTGMYGLAVWGIMLCLSGCILLLSHTLTLFLIGLSLNHVGISLIRPNLMALIGNMARQTNTGSDFAYRSFYLLSNAGSLLGMMTSTLCYTHLSWSAACWIVIATYTLILLILLRHQSPFQQFSNQKHLHRRQIIGLVLSTAAVPITIIMVVYAGVSQHLLPIIFVGLIGGLFIISRSQKSLGLSWFKFMVITILINVVFFALYEQQSNTLLLFIDRHVDRILSITLDYSVEVPTALFQTVDPLFNIIIGISVAYIFNQLEKQQRQISHYTKCGLGFLSLGIGFFSLIAIKHFTAPANIPMYGIMIAYFFIVIGEILVLPTTMAIFNQLSPARWRTFSMGIWSTSLGVAEYLMVFFASQTSHGVMKQTGTPCQQLDVYCNSFYQFGIISLVVSLTILLNLKKLRTSNL